jgi:DNA-directed RNA polymerase specialized sigma24 family protein
MWLPDGKSVAGVRQELETTLAAAFAQFEAEAPRSGVGGPDELLPVAATAVARALLQDAVEGAKTQPAGQLPSETLKATLAQLQWGDLLLAAACANKNDAANRRLLALIETQVAPALSKKWGRDRAQDLADELPQKLHLSDERGLNRGRPKLLSYGGRARLATWLQAIGHRGAIERWRRQGREQSDDDLSGAPDRGGGDGVVDQLTHDEDLDLVRRVGPQAFEQLMQQLPAVSEQQYRFAYFRCVGGLDASEIANRLGVGKSRVTELSQQVFRRLVAIMRRLAPELESMSDEASTERRRHVEEALQAWFGKDAAAAGAGGTDDDHDQPTLRVTGVER